MIIIILEMRKGGSGKLGHWSKFMQLVLTELGFESAWLQNPDSSILHLKCPYDTVVR